MHGQHVSEGRKIHHGTRLAVILCKVHSWKDSLQGSHVTPEFERYLVPVLWDEILKKILSQERSGYVIRNTNRQRER